jgi:serine/threonine protein kinase
MKTGDVVHDAQGRSYQVGPLLGRGSWGKSYLVRDGDSRAEFVLKCPLGKDDFRGDVPMTDALLDQCASACKEQAQLLDSGDHAFLPPLQSTELDDGSPLIVLPRFTTTLDRRMAQGCTLAEVISVLLEAAGHLSEWSKLNGPHGNLRPSNLLLNDRGQVLLTDMITPAADQARGQLQALNPEPNGYLPPEVLAGGDVTGSADTYALAMILYRAVITPRDGDTEGRTLTLPSSGMDKADLVSLKNAAVERLSAEDSNPRFHGRFSERLASLLNRALSVEMTPSPPFRFNRLSDLVPRLLELQSLIRPNIESVGRMLLDRPPGSSTYETDEECAFSVSVATTPGVDSYEEIATGVALFNVESDERVRDVQCHYTCERHPSGRYRFAFRLLELDPGRYRCRVAFAIRDSGHPPVTSEDSFEVRAAAGYVPTERALSTQPIPFGRQEQDDGGGETEPMAPMPVAPPQPEPTEPKPQVERAVASVGAPIVDRPPPVRLPPPRPVNDPVPVTFEQPVQVELIPDEPAPTEAETTEPAVQLHTQLPERDPLRDIMGARSWADVPLPGDARDELGPPLLDDDPEPPMEGPLERFIDMLRGDRYMLGMTALGGILVLLIAVFALLKLTQ